MTTSSFRDDVAAQALALPVFQWFGIELDYLANGQCVARLPWREELSHAPDTFQANPIAALADFAGVLAGLTALPEGSTAATVDYTVKFLFEARGSELIAHAQLIAPGSTISVSRVDIFVRQDDAEIHCATALITMRNRRAGQMTAQEPESSSACCNSECCT